MNNKTFGEIIESSLGHWRGQSWQWDYFPPFASLVTVKTENLILLGLIYDVKTGSADSSREPFAYQKTEEELRQQQPHIFSFLKTTFSCIPLGFVQEHRVWHQMPPVPPKIHAFVEHASAQTVGQFFTEPDFVSRIAHATAVQPLVDELLIAIIQQQLMTQALTKSQLDAILDHYNLVCAHDYRRLKQMSQRLQSFMYLRDRSQEKVVHV